MAIIQKLIAVLGLDPREFDKQLKGAEKSLKKTAAKLEEVGRSLTLGVTLPLVSIGAVAVKSFADFDSALTKSTAIMGDVADQMEDLQEAALEVGRTSTFGAAQAAEAFFFLASAGLDAEQSIAALPKVASFAQAGMFDLAKATDLLTDAQSALGLTVEDTEENIENLVRVSDVLVKANTIANASVQQFSESLTNQAAASARNAGIEIEEVVSVLAAFADQGIKGAEAGTKFAIVVRDLSTKAVINAKAFERFGISVFDASGNLLPLAQILRQLEQRFGDVGLEAQKAAFQTLGFADRSIGALQSLLGLSDTIEDYEKQLRSAGGITELVAQKQLKSFTAEMKLMKNAITEVFIVLGQELVEVIRDDLLPILEGAIEFFAKLVEVFTQLDGTTKRIIIGMVAFAAAVGPAAIVVGTLLKVFAALATIISGPAIALIVIGGGLLTGLGILALEGTKAATATEKLGEAFEELDDKSKEFIKTQERVAELDKEYGKLETRLASLVEKEAELTASLTDPFTGGRKAVQEFGKALEFETILNLVQVRKELERVQMAMLDIAEMPSLISTGGIIPEETGGGIDGLIKAFDFLGERGREAFEGIAGVAKASFTAIGETIDGVIVTADERFAAFMSSISEKQEAFRMQANEAWTDYLAISTDVISNVKLATLDFLQSFSAGFGDAIAQIIVFQEDFAEVMKKFLTNLLAQVVSTITQIVTNWLIGTIAQAVIGTAIHTQRVGQALQMIYLSSVAAFSAIPIVGPIIAPALAATATIAAASASIAAAAAGAAVAGAGSIPLALDTGGLILNQGIAKLHTGERVLRADEVRAMPDVMGSGMMMVTVELDGQILTQKIIERVPRELRMRGL